MHSMLKLSIPNITLFVSDIDFAAFSSAMPMPPHLVFQLFWGPLKYF